MNYKVIIINGVATSGKDTFCKFVKKYYQGRVVNYSAIDPVKMLLRNITNNKKTDKERKLWATVKDALTEYDDIPFRWIIDTVRRFNEYFARMLSPNKPPLYFIHCRGPEEIQKLKDHYGDRATTLLIKRDVGISDNSGDSLVESGEYDMQIDNIGTLDELEAMAKHFAENYLPKRVL